VPRAVSLACASLAVLASRCGGEVTEIVVAIDTDLQVPAEAGAVVDIDQIHVTARPASGSAKSQPISLGSDGPPFPVTVGVLAGSDPDGSVEISAEGRVWAGGTTWPVVVQRARVRFVRGESRKLALTLCDACADLASPGARTCKHGSWSDIEDFILAPWTGDVSVEPCAAPNVEVGAPWSAEHGDGGGGSTVAGAAGSGGEADGGAGGAGGVSALCATKDHSWLAGGHCYFVVPTETSWATADASCRAGGAELVAITDAVEYATVRAHLAAALPPIGAPAALWLGLSRDDVDEPFDSWSNGETKPAGFAYPWDVANDEPNDGPNRDQNCVSMSTDGWKWFTYKCTAQRGYVCETQ
jgi:hypothetical protein